MTDPQPSQSNAQLCPKSQAAVDALADNSFDTTNLQPEHAARCGPLASLLARLRAGPNPCRSEETAVNATLARINAAAPSTFTLSEEDEDALELLVAHHWDPRKVPSAVRSRAERQAATLAILSTTAPIDTVARDARVAATLARIASEGQAQSQRMRLHEPVHTRRTFGLRNAAAVAAVLAVGATVAIPALNSVRARAQQTACLGNLGGIAQALSGYATQANDALPMASTSRAGSIWWNVGNPSQSNSANLFNLVPTGFTKPAQLSCCGNSCAKDATFTDACRDWQSIDQVSYSFQNQFSRQRNTLHADNTLALLADKNPAVRRAARGERLIYVDENSPNHGGQGQNVLFADGNARWLTSPFTSDTANIWLPRAWEDLIAKAANPSKARLDAFRGIEEPEKADTFLVP